MITSGKNPVVRRFRAAAAGELPDVMVADGIGPVEEVLAARRPVREVVVSPRLAGSARGAALRERLLAVGLEVREAGDGVLQRLSGLTTHQGVVAIVERPSWQRSDLLGPGAALVVVAAGVRDPGNTGALVRTAEAAGATGLVALAGGADPFRDKAVRAAAGSALRLPVLGGQDPDAVVAWLREADVQIVVAEAVGEGDYLGADWRRPTALAVGAEAAGVPEALRVAASVRTRIPMAAPVESLNVAVAAGILLYEARRQRQ